MGEILGCNLFRLGQVYDPNGRPMGAYCHVCGRWDYWFVFHMCEDCYLKWQEEHAIAEQGRVP